MARLKGIVSEIGDGQAVVVLDDGVRLIFPVDKFPKRITVGTFVTISIRVDHITTLLNRQPAPKLSPKGQGL